MPQQLQQGLDIFANWQTVVFCLAVYMITYVIRTIVESLPNLQKFAGGWVWQELLLPLGPIATGVILALLSKKFPWPVPIADVFSVKLMYGGICGMTSGWMYSRVRAFFGVAADSGNQFAAKVLKRPPSNPPPASPQAVNPTIPPTPPVPPVQ